MALSMGIARAGGSVKGNAGSNRVKKGLARLDGGPSEPEGHAW